MKFIASFFSNAENIGTKFKVEITDQNMRTMVGFNIIYRVSEGYMSIILIWADFCHGDLLLLEAIY